MGRVHSYQAGGHHSSPGWSSILTHHGWSRKSWASVSQDKEARTQEGNDPFRTQGGCLSRLEEEHLHALLHVPQAGFFSTRGTMPSMVTSICPILGYLLGCQGQRYIKASSHILKGMCTAAPGPKRPFSSISPGLEKNAHLETL